MLKRHVKQHASLLTSTALCSARQKRSYITIILVHENHNKETPPVCRDSVDSTSVYYAKIFVSISPPPPTHPTSLCACLSLSFYHFSLFFPYFLTLYHLFNSVFLTLLLLSSICFTLTFSSLACLSNNIFTPKICFTVFLIFRF